MTFQPGHRVSHIGMAIPMIVETINGDDVTVIRYDAKGKPNRETYKAATLQLTPQRRPITFRL